MITTVIIDDEKRSISVLQTLLTDYCPEVSIVGTSDDALKGVELIRQKQPDLVFLDIRMPGINAFELLDHFNDPQFRIVFTTAYDNHAVKAIKYAALDYLLKPIGIEDLKGAISRFNQQLQKPGNRLHVLAENERNPLKKYSKIAIPSVHGYDFLDTADIVWINASDAYSVFHLTNGSTITASSNLKKYEELLDNTTFLRIHHSHIININHVKKYIRAKNAYVIMLDGTELEISQRRKDVMSGFIQSP